MPHRNLNNILHDVKTKNKNMKYLLWVDWIPFDLSQRAEKRKICFEFCKTTVMYI